jgi:hypothetical protein
MLPDDGIKLPKHVGAVVWNKKEYKIQCIWLDIFYATLCIRFFLAVLEVDFIFDRL